MNYNLEDQKYLYVIISIKNKFSIIKKMNSIDCWIIPKKPWDERICHLSNSQEVKDEMHFLLKFLPYVCIRLQFQNIFNDTNIPNLLTHQNYGDLEQLFFNLLKHSSTIPYILFVRFHKPNLI